ncbi:MAG TPA: Wzz/FepE/Etk N-terminal domain-containing protein, partial [Devosia sp.]|nr:Wzz/FepE/Etk N-terminal domain-containing protein [Devosia sp.]
MQPRFQVNQVTMLSNIDFGFYFALFRRRLPLFITVVVLVASVGTVVTLLWPPSYVATAKILVESPQIPTDLAKSTVPTGAAERFQIIQEDVLSRTNVAALAEQF